MDELASRVPGESREMGSSFSDGEDIESRLVSASAFVSGYGSGYDEGYGYAAAYSRDYMRSRQDDYAVRRPGSSEYGVGGLGLQGIPRSSAVTEDHPDSVEDMTTPRPRHSEPHRRRANSTSEWRSIDLLALPPSGGVRQGSHRTLDQVLGTDRAVHPREARPGDPNMGEATQNMAGRNSMNSTNSSMSSWGTVETSIRGSMSDLGLIGLHRGGVTGHGSAADGAHTTAIFGRDLEDDDEAGTPRTATFNPRSVPLGFQVEPRAARARGDNERARHSRSLSHPVVPLPLDGSSNQHSSLHDGQSPHSRQPSLTQSVSLDSGARPPSIYGSQPSNALDLTFDAGVPFSVDAVESSNAQICAPTPRVGGPNVLDLWRSDA
jgi:hypothetical protein